MVIASGPNSLPATCCSLYSNARAFEVKKTLLAVDNPAPLIKLRLVIPFVGLDSDPWFLSSIELQMNLLNFQSNYTLESYDNIHLERIKISYNCPYRIYKKGLE
jgi:hypothetical protein